jgi:sugar (glycoside-pentoside-hexuronide) transporter
MATTSEPTSVSPGAAAAIDAATAPPALPLGVRMAYGLGDVASQFVWTITSSYLALFYTDAVGFPAASVAALMLIARVFDAVIDPFIGAMAERTRTRWGRFRPWILFGMLPLAVLVVLAFTAPFGDGTLGFVFAVITYGLLGALYSAVNVPYGALSAVMSERTSDRVSLNSWRMVGTNLGGITLSLIILPMVVLFSGVGDGHTQTVHGYTLTAAVFAVASIPLFFAVFKTSKEIISPERGAGIAFRSTVRVVFTNGPLLLLFATLLFSLISMFGRISIVLYYYIYNVGNFGLVSILMALAPAATIVGILLFAPLGRRFGKRNMLIVSLTGQAIALAVLYFVDYHNVTAVIVVTCFYGLANFGIPLSLAMVADCVDYADDRSGIRSDGTAYALTSFATKLASAIGGAAGLALLGAFGYVANQPQSAEVQSGINLVVNVMPAVAAVIAIVPMLFYRLSESRYAEIRHRLDTRSLQVPKGV